MTPGGRSGKSGGRSGLTFQKAVSTVVVVLLAIAVWWWQSSDSSDQADRTPDSRTDRHVGGEQEPGTDAKVPPSANADNGHANAGQSGTDSHSGLHWVSVDELPDEAEDTLRLIDAGGPFRYDRDGITFGNREGILPDRTYGHYHEYTVPTPGSRDRGARRIVTGGTDEYYWTEDHYESFERIDW